MTLRRVSLSLVALLVGATSILSPQQNAASAQKISTLLAEAETLATVRFENEDALRTFERVYQLDTNCYDALIGISRAYVDIGEHLPGRTDAEKEEQLRLYQLALDYAEKAVRAKPDGSMAFTRRAIANGRIALFKGVWTSVGLVKQVKEDTDKAIALDPANATAHYILGRTHAKVSEKPGIVRWPLGLSWASMEDAVKCYEQAITLRPDFIMYRLDAARAYVELDDEEHAREHLEAIPSIATADEDDEQYRKEAMNLRKELGM